MALQNIIFGVLINLYIISVSTLILSSIEDKKWPSYVSVFTITASAFYFINKLIR